jgi:hypothetical protein
MDEALLAYNAGRIDGGRARRNAKQAADPETGADYRIGFLDGRVEVFRMLSNVRKFLDESD